MPGYPSIAVGLMVLGGVQLMMIGVLGEYIGKLLSETKARPVYFVAEHSVKTRRRHRQDDARARARNRRCAATAPAYLALRRRLRHFARVNAAIRELIMRGRLNATSVMVLAPHFDRGDARSLQMLNAGAKRAAIGLHLTLTAPFEPVSESFTPKRDGRFLPMKSMQLAALARRLDRRALKLEIAAQIHAFAGAFGHLPDYIDGHQHVHLFPQMREALLEVMAEMTPKAWVRQCGRARAARRLRDHKAVTLDMLSAGFRQKVQGRYRHQSGLRRQLSFFRDAVFAKIFPRFLEGLPDGGLIMCHPGFVDCRTQAPRSAHAFARARVRVFHVRRISGTIAGAQRRARPPAGRSGSRRSL